MAWNEPLRFDWQQPWLLPLAVHGERAWAAVAAGATVAAAVNDRRPRTEPASGLEPVRRSTPGVHFAPAAELPESEAYESFIARTGRVPTRDNAHDFFNALMWLHRPTIKACLNALQAAEIARQGVAGQRGALRDALTLFDENGAVLHATTRLADALRCKDWRALFVTHRSDWQSARFEVFGHALIEKLATAPRKALTAHVLLVDPLDLTPQDWASKPFCPLPVLGTPGWWPGNEDPAFYADAAIFRSPGTSMIR